MTTSGSNFFISQGEDFAAVFAVVDADSVAYSLAGGAAAFSYWQGSGSVADGTCSISTSNVTVTIPRATIKTMSGTYNYEFWSRNSTGTIRLSATGIIQVSTSKDPDAVAP